MKLVPPITMILIALPVSCEADDGVGVQPRDDQACPGTCAENSDVLGRASWRINGRRADGMHGAHGYVDVLARRAGVPLPVEVVVDDMESRLGRADCVQVQGEHLR